MSDLFVKYFVNISTTITLNRGENNKIPHHKPYVSKTNVDFKSLKCYAEILIVMPVVYDNILTVNEIFFRI